MEWFKNKQHEEVGGVRQKDSSGVGGNATYLVQSNFLSNNMYYFEILN